MSRTDRHKELKQRKRRTLEKAFDYAVETALTLVDWLGLHENVKEEDYAYVVGVLQHVDIVVTDIANLFHHAYGYYTQNMLALLGEETDDDLDEGESENE